MHLTDGGDTNGFGIDAGKSRLQRFAQGRFEMGDQFFIGDGGGLVLKLLELGNPVQREQVHPGGQYLPEFDESGAHLFHGMAQSLGGTHAQHVRAHGTAHQLAGMFHRSGKPQSTNYVGKAVFEQNGGQLIHA